MLWAFSKFVDISGPFKKNGGGRECLYNYKTPSRVPIAIPTLLTILYASFP